METGYGGPCTLRPSNALGSNEVPKEWLWKEQGRRQSPTLISRVGQNCAGVEMEWSQ